MGSYHNFIKLFPKHYPLITNLWSKVSLKILYKKTLKLKSNFPGHSQELQYVLMTGIKKKVSCLSISPSLSPSLCTDSWIYSLLLVPEAEPQIQAQTADQQNYQPCKKTVPYVCLIKWNTVVLCRKDLPKSTKPL